MEVLKTSSSLFNHPQLSKNNSREASQSDTSKFYDALYQQFEEKGREEVKTQIILQFYKESNDSMEGAQELEYFLKGYAFFYEQQKDSISKQIKDIYFSQIQRYSENFLLENREACFENFVMNQALKGEKALGQWLGFTHWLAPEAYPEFASLINSNECFLLSEEFGEALFDSRALQSESFQMDLSQINPLEMQVPNFNQETFEKDISIFQGIKKWATVASENKWTTRMKWEEYFFASFEVLAKIYPFEKLSKAFEGTIWDGRELEILFSRALEIKEKKSISLLSDLIENSEHLLKNLDLISFKHKAAAKLKSLEKSSFYRAVYPSIFIFLEKISREPQIWNWGSNNINFISSEGIGQFLNYLNQELKFENFEEILNSLKPLSILPGGEIRDFYNKFWHKYHPEESTDSKIKELNLKLQNLSLNMEAFDLSILEERIFETLSLLLIENGKIEEVGKCFEELFFIQPQFSLKGLEQKLSNIKKENGMVAWENLIFPFLKNENYQPALLDLWFQNAHSKKIDRAVCDKLLYHLSESRQGIDNLINYIPQMGSSQGTYLTAKLLGQNQGDKRKIWENITHSQLDSKRVIEEFLNLGGNLFHLSQVFPLEEQFLKELELKNFEALLQFVEQENKEQDPFAFKVVVSFLEKCPQRGVPFFLKYYEEFVGSPLTKQDAKEKLDIIFSSPDIYSLNEEQADLALTFLKAHIHEENRASYIEFFFPFFKEKAAGKLPQFLSILHFQTNEHIEDLIKEQISVVEVFNKTSSEEWKKIPFLAEHVTVEDLKKIKKKKEWIHFVLQQGNVDKGKQTVGEYCARSKINKLKINENRIFSQTVSYLELDDVENLFQKVNTKFSGWEFFFKRCEKEKSKENFLRLENLIFSFFKKEKKNFSEIYEEFLIIGIKNTLFEAHEIELRLGKWLLSESYTFSASFARALLDKEFVVSDFEIEETPPWGHLFEKFQNFLSEDFKQDKACLFFLYKHKILNCSTKDTANTLWKEINQLKNFEGYQHFLRVFVKFQMIKKGFTIEKLPLNPFKDWSSLPQEIIKEHSTWRKLVVLFGLDLNAKLITFDFEDVLKNLERKDSLKISFLQALIKKIENLSPSFLNKRLDLKFEIEQFLNRSFTYFLEAGDDLFFISEKSYEGWAACAKAFEIDEPNLLFIKLYFLSILDKNSGSFPGKVVWETLEKLNFFFVNNLGFIMMIPDDTFGNYLKFIQKVPKNINKNQLKLLLQPLISLYKSCLEVKSKPYENLNYFFETRKILGNFSQISPRERHLIFLETYASFQCECCMEAYQIYLEDYGKNLAEIDYLKDQKCPASLKMRFRKLQEKYLTKFIDNFEFYPEISCQQWEVFQKNFHQFFAKNFAEMGKDFLSQYLNGLFPLSIYSFVARVPFNYFDKIKELHQNLPGDPPNQKKKPIENFKRDCLFSLRLHENSIFTIDWTLKNKKLIEGILEKQNVLEKFLCCFNLMVLLRQVESLPQKNVEQNILSNWIKSFKLFDSGNLEKLKLSLDKYCPTSPYQSEIKEKFQLQIPIIDFLIQENSYKKSNKIQIFEKIAEIIPVGNFIAVDRNLEEYILNLYKKFPKDSCDDILRLFISGVEKKFKKIKILDCPLHFKTLAILGGKFFFELNEAQETMVANLIGSFKSKQGSESLLFKFAIFCIYHKKIQLSILGMPIDLETQEDFVRVTQIDLKPSEVTFNHIENLYISGFSRGVKKILRVMDLDEDKNECIFDILSDFFGSSSPLTQIISSDNDSLSMWWEGLILALSDLLLANPKCVEKYFYRNPVHKKFSDTIFGLMVQKFLLTVDLQESQEKIFQTFFNNFKDEFFCKEEKVNYFFFDRMLTKVGLAHEMTSYCRLQFEAIKSEFISRCLSDFPKEDLQFLYWASRGPQEALEEEKSSLT